MDGSRSVSACHALDNLTLLEAGHHDTCASVLQESTKLCKDDHHDLWQTIAQKTQNVFVSDVYSVLKSAIVFESDVSSSVWRLKAKGSETGIHYNIAIKLK